MQILFEDTDLIVIDKPADMVVNQARTARGQTVQAWLAQRLIDQDLAKFENRGANSRQLAQLIDKQPDDRRFVSLVARSDWQKLVLADFDTKYGTPEEIFHQRWGIVHRLDKDTSGVLVLAKNPGALVNLLAQFKQRQTKKEYLALVHGQVEPDRGMINLPLGRSKSNFKKISIQPEGRVAETNYQVTQKLPPTDQVIDQILDRVGETNNFTPAQLLDLRQQMKKTYEQGFCWVRCQPKTGRMHQIRVHLSAIHHPLVGDSLYLGRKRLKLDRLWTQGQILQAVKLEFRHPRSGEVMEVSVKGEMFI
ncbi:MAG: RluA family pseudouridine synthase [Patescibacteria group bacterium]|nr:RluA family pseudouridine synthase [Patescibacteria group bacterium]